MGRKGGGGGGMRVKQMGGPTKEQKAMMKQMAEGGGMGMGGNPMDQFMIPPDQMINLPPTPNRKTQLFWPMHETFSMDHKTFFVIYPSYMDSCKTMKLGRRIGIENSIPTPTVNDISEGLQILNLRHVIEPYKGYSRDITALWDNPGRVKVEPIDGDSQYTKRSLLIELSSIIITLPSRIRRIEVIIAVEKAKSIKRQEQLLIKKTQQLAITSSSNQSKSSTTKNKKKGKKKR